jgi:hypothetical protein
MAWIFGNFVSCKEKSRQVHEEKPVGQSKKTQKSMKEEHTVT